MTDQPTPVHQLGIAEAPAKADMLALLDEVRAGVEDGSVICLVAIPVHPNNKWTTRVAGDIRVLELAGILGRAWLDALEIMGND